MILLFLASGSPAAGKYGALDDCDIPLVTVQSLFEYLATIKDQVLHFLQCMKLAFKLERK